MGFVDSSADIKIYARLTEYGRSQLLANRAENVIKFFALGDSDGNYNTTGELVSGEIPTPSGEITTSDCPMKDVFGDENSHLRYKLRVSNTTDVFKSVESGSGAITNEIIESDFVTGVTASTINLDRTDLTSSDTNYFFSLNLPITTTQQTKYLTTFNSGGFSNTALSGFNVDDVVMLSINKADYGELIDGKTLKLNLFVDDPTSGSTEIEIYGTYQSGTLTTLDGNFNEKTSTANDFGNVVFLFSDYVQEPNADTSKSWATGYGINKPYSLGSKEPFNLISTASLNRDESIGVAHLDKGLIGLTQSAITSTLLSASGVTAEFAYINQQLSQTIICEASRSEFYLSANPTFTSTDTVRISEVGLYDENFKLVAVGKLDRHINKKINDIAIFVIKIIL
jgi:hypothetical protein